MIKVASANFYVGNTNPQRDAKFLTSTGIDIAGIQEGHSGNVNGIRDGVKDSYKVILIGNDLEQQDVPVVVSRKLKVIKSWGRRISARSQTENIGMPRYATAVRFKDEGENYRFINTHTNAAVQSRTTGQPLSTRIKRVREFIAGMIVLEAMIRAGKKAGDHIILVGDLNYREVKKGVWKFSPQGLFDRTRMSYRNRGLDYIAVSSGLNIEDFKVLDADETGSDHPWVFAVVETKSNYGFNKYRA